MNQVSNLTGELVRKQDVYNLLHGLGGCDAREEWAKGWDAAIDAAIGGLDDLPVMERGYKLKVCPYCGGNAKFIALTTSSSHKGCGMGVKAVCAKCGAEVQPNRIYPVEFKLQDDGTVEASTDGLSKAADEWNCRSYDDEEEDDEWS